MLHLGHVTRQLDYLTTITTNKLFILQDGCMRLGHVNDFRNLTKVTLYSKTGKETFDIQSNGNDSFVSFPNKIVVAHFWKIQDDEYYNENVLKEFMKLNALKKFHEDSIRLKLLYDWIFYKMQANAYKDFLQEADIYDRTIYQRIHNLLQTHYDEYFVGRVWA